MSGINGTKREEVMIRAVRDEINERLARIKPIVVENVIESPEIKSTVQVDMPAFARAIGESLDRFAVQIIEVMSIQQAQALAAMVEQREMFDEAIEAQGAMIAALIAQLAKQPGPVLNPSAINFPKPGKRTAIVEHADGGETRITFGEE